MIVEILPAMLPRHYSISSSYIIRAPRAATAAFVAGTAFPASHDRVFGLATNCLQSGEDGSYLRRNSYTQTFAEPLLQPGYSHAHAKVDLQATSYNVNFQ